MTVIKTRTFEIDSTVPIKLFFVALRIPGVLGYKHQRPIKNKKREFKHFFNIVHLK
jgi:hypothetical protein